MKLEALTIAAAERDSARKLHILREYVQAFALRSLHESGAFLNLSFVGGTALRFLFGLPRFSEDLDFSLENEAGYDLQKWAGRLERDLRFAGFDAAVAVRTDKVVHSASVRISGLIQDAGLAAHPGQKLSVRLEVDSNPPRGARMETRVVNRFFLFGIRHHDLSCLMAGKIRAILARPYGKGRDWYDLLWYLTRVPPVDPSLPFLEASLDQGASRKRSDAGRWREVLAHKAAEADWKTLVADVEPFLERRNEKELLTSENVLRSLRTQ